MRAEDLDRIAVGVGRTPPVTQAAAHVYPAAAPAFQRNSGVQREAPQGNRLRLYVHLPFCNYKCNFCHYATRVGDDRPQQERYVAALERELELVPAAAPLTQLFVGGGTPTALPADLLDRLLAAIFDRVAPVGDEVHTVEASPESLTAEHVRVLRSRGIGRISMGIQSLDSEVLGAIHRRHSVEQVLAAGDLALDGGLILNVDLMYGLPNQSEQSFRRDLEQVAALGVHSVTLYDLRVTQRSALGRRLSDEERLDLENLIRWRTFVRDTTAELGFTQTRWHTFKRLDRIASRHDRAPCAQGDSLGYQVGIGMSARSHLGYTVYRNHERIQEYMARVESGRSPVEYVFHLDQQDRRTQYLARTMGDGKPLDLEAFSTIFGEDFRDLYGDAMQRQLESGLLSCDDDILTLTEAGRLVYDRVMLNYYPQRAIDWLWAQA